MPCGTVLVGKTTTRLPAGASSAACLPFTVSALRPVEEIFAAEMGPEIFASDIAPSWTFVVVTAPSAILTVVTAPVASFAEVTALSWRCPVLTPLPLFVFCPLAPSASLIFADVTSSFWIAAYAGRDNRSTARTERTTVLIMLILIGILPGAYALNLETNAAAIAHLHISARTTGDILKSYAGATALKAEEADDELSNFLSSAGTVSERTYAALQMKNGYIAEQLNGKRSFRELSRSERGEFRTVVYLVGKSLDKLHNEHTFTDPRERNHLTAYRADLDHVTRFIPDFVKYAVALALGLGTMIGWKRIVVTVGEKIGKAHLTYAQGAAAELVAMSTIGAADYWGLPVSTTHVLSSGVAGTMAANRSGLQMNTLKNLLLAWVLTLPVCVLLGATFFAAGLYIVAHWLGL